MAMTLGSASVADDHTVNKSGVIGKFYDQILASIPGGVPMSAGGLAIKRAIAKQATIQGTVLYSVLTQDARARITQEDIGLQRMPASTTENTNCKGPSENKYLTIV